MEWVRQRYRFRHSRRLDNSGSSDSNNIRDNKLVRLLPRDRSQSVMVLFVISCVISILPCAVLSASDPVSAGINSVDYKYNNNYESSSGNGDETIKLNAHGPQIWRKLRQAGPNPGESSSANLSFGETPVFGDETEASTTTKKPKRPILHRKPIPDAVNSKDSGNFSSNNGSSFKDQLDNVGQSSHGHRPEGESEGEDLHKIQSILRDIFLDEFTSEEEPEDEDPEVTKYTLIHGDLSRSSQNELKNASLVPISRHIRSEPDVPEGRAGLREKKPKGSRASNQKSNSSSNGKGRQKKKSPKGSDIGKYNGYMDSVFRRMNTMIKTKKMDPLRVNLYAGASKNPGKPESSGGKGKKKYSPRMNLDSEEEAEEEQEVEDDDDDDIEGGPARRDIFLNVSNHDDQEEPMSTRTIRALLESVNATAPETSDSPRGSDSKPKKGKQSTSNRDKTSGTNKGSKGQSGSGGNKKNGSKNKKNNRNQKTRPTRGILHGLSTLKREGNVVVIKQGEQARIVQANFLLGPVSLEIMPKKGKTTDGGKPVAATATAARLKGVLEVRLKKGSPTRIRKLRVYPPKNVKVEGSGSTLQGSKGGKKPQQYGKVTPMATARLRQIASTVVRQADRTHKNP